jgi:predicted AAA+ superfamily ATPase
LGTGSQSNIIVGILLKPPPGYVFLVMASQDSRYDLFMLTLIRRALELKLKTLEVVTEARNRKLMAELAEMQNDDFKILEMSYGQKTLGVYTCSPYLHEINI